MIWEGFLVPRVCLRLTGVAASGLMVIAFGARNLHAALAATDLRRLEIQRMRIKPPDLLAKISLRMFAEQRLLSIVAAP